MSSILIQMAVVVAGLAIFAGFSYFEGWWNWSLGGRQKYGVLLGGIVLVAILIAAACLLAAIRDLAP